MSALLQQGEGFGLWTVTPFVLLLLCIAILPIVAPHWWEANRNKAIVSWALGLPVAIYVGLSQPHRVMNAAHEYVSFIALLAALYVISGGFVLRGDIRATPAVNTTFLAVGAVLANFIGTTGASMALIRPLLHTNAEREHKTHIPLFFIFIVSNIGGMLTPLGDPPLFLGYLRGVPFFWTLRLTPIWLFNVGILLILFFVWDRIAYRKESAEAIRRDIAAQVPLAPVGNYNWAFLGGVVGAAFLPSPWREIGMAAMVGLSLYFTPRALRQENRFTYGPIVELAVLFLGIFLTMIPAIDILERRGVELGFHQAWHFFWATGLLSSFLDNAPTYVSFFSLAEGLGHPREVAGIAASVLRAISAGAVCMGANSYIGNGPNFMVKAIAEEEGIRMPSFFGYVGYAALILIPLFVLDTVIFFRP